MQFHDYQELCLLEPRLRELEVRSRATHDDGKGTFYCSNYVWLPLNSDLKDLIGVARRPLDGEAEEGKLFDSKSYELAYEHLSPLLPPCRDCGCVKFKPYLDAQIDLSNIQWDTSNYEKPEPLDPGEA